ncbi:hypothetical protein POSPLADRAFT_1055571 [Postia placenta MAD-698-R-SB12]|uniref:Uncharacterized protein n=1 Tax=Postia placenta MAD-698-R-SB12 TaxID=670580 RepID=A0A1X6N4W1_9APHY|nr:hypothetical protein POSPLADRAFT_1055571 [Postia placenta MAD-698-R-SB12]OSX63516.1 hypothetical protein POSPLADRAFT_1055571 [Postia placenta MAD-698-R-SB12]
MQINWKTWFVVSSLVSATLGLPPSGHGNETDLICRPFGTCEPCPEDALHEPFCQPFGNRKLVHCYPASASPSNSPHFQDYVGPEPPPLYDDQPPPRPDPEPTQGAIPAWESCGRIVEKERADFYEFLACNFAIAIVALIVLFARSKRLQAMHARQLAARIGLVRGAPGGWTNG